MKILRDPNLAPTEKEIVKSLLQDIQDAMSGLKGGVVNEFVLGEDEYEKLPKIISEAAPEFVSSIEYETVAKENFDLPGVVVGAFVNFLLDRLCQYPVEDAVIQKSFSLIESLYRLENYKVRSVVEEDIVERLKERGDLLEKINPHLGPTLKKLLAGS